MVLLDVGFLGYPLLAVGHHYPPPVLAPTDLPKFALLLIGITDALPFVEAHHIPAALLVKSSH